MLILLPPSEKKKSATSDKNFDLDTLAFASELTAPRKTLLTDLDTSKTSPAMEIYDGVLYQGLGWHTLPTSAKKRANSRVLIVSALFGLVRPLDQIFGYKLKIDNQLWRESISLVSANFVADLIIDCRSSTYKGVWQLNPDRTVEVRVFKVVNGQRSVITHMSKKYRGELTRNLLMQATEPTTPADVKRIAAELFDCELHPPVNGDPWALDLLIS